MEMYHCEERIYVLPENAICKADEYIREVKSKIDDQGGVK